MIEIGEGFGLILVVTSVVSFLTGLIAGWYRKPLRLGCIIWTLLVVAGTVAYMLLAIIVAISEGKKADLGENFGWVVVAFALAIATELFWGLPFFLLGSFIGRALGSFIRSKSKEKSR